MLEAVHQSSESGTPLVFTLAGVDMSDQYGNSTVSFNLQQLRLQPFELVGRIASLGEQVGVELIARVCVVADDLGTLRH